MKLCLLLITIAVVSALNYNNPSEWSGSAGCINVPSNPGWDIYNYKSPIVIKSSGCLPYGYFNLNLPDFSGAYSPDATRGTLSAAYTGGSLQSDQFTWNTRFVYFRRKSEHRLFTNDPANPTADAAASDLEMQIEMQDANGRYAMLSFLIMALTPTNKSQVLAMNNQGGDFISIANGDYNLKLNALATSIMKKQSQEVFLNMFTYNGTLTYPPCTAATWFISGGQLYTAQTNVDNFNSQLTLLGVGNLNVTNGVNYNARPWGQAGTSSSVGGGAQFAARLCFTGYFDVYLNWNYGLWFGVVIIVCFFILTLSIGESPITDYDYVEEYKTIHPLVSLYKYGNELHTRKSRGALVLVTLTMHALFSSVFYRISNNRHQPANIIVYAVYSMIISQFFLIFYGSILRAYYVAKSQFIATKDEKWNQKAQNRLFAYYSGLFGILALCWPFCVWNMNEINPHGDKLTSNYWVASFFVGIGLEWLVIDIIWCLLASKIHFIKRLIKNKAFMYDNMMHKTYLDFIKMD